MKKDRFSLSDIEPGLIDSLGKDLYRIFYEKNIKQDLPFGVKGKYSFDDRSLNLRKRFGKNRDFQFDFTIGKNEALLNLKKEF